MLAPMLSPDKALARLREGNQRFTSNVRSVESLLTQLRRDRLARSQAPFAAVLACADSRVPVEWIFDQGMGDLFVVRVAGNIVTPAVLGSIEFAAERLGTRLVVVLGHTNCGAVQAALASANGTDTEVSPNLLSIVTPIRAAVAPVLEGEQEHPQAGLAEAVRLNVRGSLRQIRQDSPVLARVVDSGHLAIVGAVYDLASGVVHFLDD